MSYYHHDRSMPPDGAMILIVALFAAKAVWTAYKLGIFHNLLAVDEAREVERQERLRPSPPSKIVLWAKRELERAATYCESFWHSGLSSSVSWQGSCTTDAAIDRETGEVIAAAVRELSWDVEVLRRARDEALALAEHAGTNLSAQTQQLARVLDENRQLRSQLSTTEVPAGKLHVIGRLVRPKEGAWLAVIAEGRAVRMRIATGWGEGFPSETGTPVAAEATLFSDGWRAWRVSVLEGDEAAGLPALDQAQVEKLTAPRPPKPEGSEILDLDDLEKDQAAASDLRRHAHHVSALSLHIVLVRHRRGVDLALTDEMAGALKAEAQDVVEKTLGWKLLAANTGSTSDRHVHDHLHLAVSHVDITQPIGKEIGRIKSIVSKRMRARFPELAALEKLWSAGYYAGGFGGPNKDAVIAYVHNQEQ